ncbi:FAD/NAD(P)-binding domain-containing protein [Macrolepiota fuliginosa MF-IS2]|uniref:FAD/NAD(P)-binding domain-containing protein n=1 Tax=Macrolepiota fuliginosa MF-IS2 TaxID=1400762 RepID=A0A9P5X7H6_9AGAR|nr:FAD/NAD(P)-binding domain-containing protein [Macrolepiota fuliginosa MF-IS2]
MTSALSHPSEAPLPTLTKLGVSSLPDDIDASKVAHEWFTSFAKKVASNDIDGILSQLLIQSSFDSTRPETADQTSVYWRDLLALTWDFRTFEGTPRIRKFLTDRLEATKISNLQLKATSDAQGLAPFLARPHSDLVWVVGMFTFETEVGLASGIFRLVPTMDGQQQLQWKAHCIFTNLEDLRDFPEKVGNLRNQLSDHGKWESIREKEKRFEDKDPTALIIGAGHSGLEIAARLKLLGVQNLIIEKNSKVGDNWRLRYDALCLHDPVWLDHLPYLSFPPNWPVFSPAKKLAKWLEFYAESMELNVWTSSTVSHVQRDASTGLYKVTVLLKGEKEETRVLTVKHVIFATGLSGGAAHVPTYPGMDKFKGQILHSTQHKKATDHLGKKVVLIGSGTSAHDLGVDYHDHGIDVTMYQRSSSYVMSVQKGMRITVAGLYEESGPPLAVADRLSQSFPNLLNVGLHYRNTLAIAEVDKETLQGLQRVGFRLDRGYKDTGFLLTAFMRTGGYYLDVGGSQYLIDGKIKLKNDSALESFTENGLKFANGSELPADVVIFCTGLGKARDVVSGILDPETFKGVGDIWGLDDEGEWKGIWGDLGVQNLWFMMGSFALSRFYSKHLALQIKAIEEGIFGTRYQTRI